MHILCLQGTNLEQNNRHDLNEMPVAVLTQIPHQRFLNYFWILNFYIKRRKQGNIVKLSL